MTIPSPVKLVLCLASSKGYAALQAVEKHDIGEQVLVCTFRDSDSEEDCFQSISELAKSIGCRVEEWKDIKSEFEEIIRSSPVSAIIAAGWRYMIPMNLLDHLSQGLFIFHDSLLPKYRGFAPTATAILCGEKESGLSVIKAAAEVDAGDIVLQKRFSLHNRITIKEAFDHLNPLYMEAMDEILDLLNTDAEIQAEPQDHSNATYSLWRSPEDGEIDWHEAAIKIDRLVRSSGYPYAGAYTFLNGRKIRILETELADEVEFVLRQPGKVWQISGNKPIVVCAKGMLKILRATDDEGNDALPIGSLRSRFGNR